MSPESTKLMNASTEVFLGMNAALPPLLELEAGVEVDATPLSPSSPRPTIEGMSPMS